MFLNPSSRVQHTMYAGSVGRAIDVVGARFAALS
jgi:hypothetical protein